jgi:hypothetical protein
MPVSFVATNFPWEFVIDPELYRSRGIPSPRWAMMFFWMCEVPPAI